MNQNLTTPEAETIVNPQPETTLATSPRRLEGPSPSSRPTLTVPLPLVRKLLQSDKTGGDLHGRFLKAEGLIQVLSEQIDHDGFFLPWVATWSKKRERRVPKLPTLNLTPGDVSATLGEYGLPVIVYDPSDYNLRNRSLVTAQRVKGTHAVLAGMGSVGSRIAYELAKHGVEVTGVDADRLEYHNGYRWGLQEKPEFLVGRHKVDAFKAIAEERIPEAKVNALPLDICRETALLAKFLEDEKPELIIVSTDTLDSQREVNALAMSMGIPTLYATLSDGAESGQILFISGKRENACFNCFSGIGAEEEDPFAQRQTRENYAVEESEAQQAVPALSVDIQTVASIATKIALAFLAGEDVKAYFKNFDNQGEVLWISNTPGTWILEDFCQKLVAKVSKDPDCPVCGHLKEGGA